MEQELFDFSEILNKRKNSPYYPRIADDILKKKLDTFGAVYITGPKWCGKTRTAEKLAHSALYLEDQNKTTSIVNIANNIPGTLLNGSKPRLLDEWQIAPVLWDAVRFSVDTENKPNQFILTGSTPVNNAITHHSGVGRIARMRMRPMSLFESGESSGAVSLKFLFNNPTPDIFAISQLDIEKLAFITVRGGWPFSINRKPEFAVDIAGEYIDGILMGDIFNFTEIKVNKSKFANLLKSLARNVSTQASIKTLTEDTQLNPTNSVSIDAVTSYLDILNKLYITEDLPAWNPSIRSKTAIRSALTRHFSDPSLVTALLNLNPTSLLTDFESFGLIFEDLCVRDLRIYADSLGGTIYHYRDKNNLEVDTVIQLKNGDWAPVEIKMGHNEIEKAAINLKRLSDKIDQTKMKPPSFMMILTATGTAYKRPDGIYVVPIGCLRN